MNGETAGSVISAFIIGAGGALTVGLAAGNGKLNLLAVTLICTTGAVAAAKDYRSLKKMPPVDNGGPTTNNQNTPITMKLFIITLIGAILTALASGCSTTNITELTKALAQDPAVVAVRVNSVYGSINFVRVGDTNRAISVDPSGTVQTK